MNLSPLIRHAAIAVAALLLMTACNTMRGVGKDTEAVGEKIQDEAEQHLDEKDDDADGGRVRRSEAPRTVASAIATPAPR